MFKYTDYALAVYEEKSFTKAAEKLFISQPSLSLTIKKLEEELGFSIFDRSGKEITLTPLGEKYIRTVKEIKKIEDDFASEIDETLKLKKGNISLGSTTFIASYILPDIIKNFTEKYPGITVNIGVEQSTVLYEKLHHGTYDLIIDNEIDKAENLSLIPLFTERIIIGIPSSFKINEKIKKFSVDSDTLCSANDYSSLPRLDMAYLKNEKFILLKHGNNMREIADELFRKAKISPSAVQEFDLLMTSINYSEHDFGICFLTDTALKYGKKCKNLKYYLPDTENDFRSVYIIHKNNSYKSAASKMFVSFLKSI